MKCLKFVCLLGAMMLFGMTELEARIKLVKFSNHSNIEFYETFTDGTPFQRIIKAKKGILIDQAGAEIAAIDGSLKIILEDAYESGFYRPQWKFNVWLESTQFPFINGNRILYAVIFYDGDGEIKLSMDASGRLHVTGGYDVKDIVYPWAVGTRGRSNPYHKIAGVEADKNGISYSDYDGFVGYPYTLAD